MGITFAIYIFSESGMVPSAIDLLIIVYTRLYIKCCYAMLCHEQNHHSLYIFIRLEGEANGGVSIPPTFFVELVYRRGRYAFDMVSQERWSFLVRAHRILPRAA